MLLTSILLVASLHGGPTAVQLPSETSETTAEGVEILRRILGDAIDQTFHEKKGRSEDEGDTQGFAYGHEFKLGVVTSLMTSDRSVQHSRAFHLPGVGLFFSIDATLPVVPREKEATEPAESLIKDDAWERKRREVRGEFLADGRKVRTFRMMSPAETEIDPKSIDQLVDVILGTLARHAGRVEGLRRGETVTVALRLSGMHRTWLHDFGQGGSGFGLGQLSETEEAPEPSEGFLSAYVLASGHETHGKSLVLRIGLDDLAGFAEGGDSARLRQRALVNLY